MDDLWFSNVFYGFQFFSPEFFRTDLRSRHLTSNHSYKLVFAEMAGKNTFQDAGMCLVHETGCLKTAGEWMASKLAPKLVDGGHPQIVSRFS